MAAALEVRDVRKSYAGVRAVDGVSFDVRPGEIFALLGPNGAGKTTLVRMLLDIIRPDAGSMRFCLDGSGGRPAAADLGYLPEERGLHKDVPLLRTLAYFGRLRGMGRQAARAAATAWLERLGLADRSRQKIEALSKGNQQKIQFAAAVIHQPRFAILDEPFSGLDPVNQDRFLDFIREMRDAGTTVLLSAHQMQLVERTADRILIIDRGREVLSGTMDEVRGRSDVGRRLVLEVAGEPAAEALLGCAGVRRVGAVSEGRVELLLDEVETLNPTLQAVAAVVPILGVHDQRPTLHDIYVDAVRDREESVA